MSLFTVVPKERGNEPKVNSYPFFSGRRGFSRKVDEIVYADLLHGEIYKVDHEADDIAEAEAYDIWPLVEEADSSEIQQFAETGSFAKMHVNSLTDGVVIVDAVWVRKWKRQPSGDRKVKSRLSTRSTTATRLSQRMRGGEQGMGRRVMGCLRGLPQRVVL